MLDIEKAFDRVDQKILIDILDKTNLNKNTLNLIKLLFNHFAYTI